MAFLILTTARFGKTTTHRFIFSKEIIRCFFMASRVTLFLKKILYRRDEARQFHFCFSLHLKKVLIWLACCKNLLSHVNTLFGVPRFDLFVFQLKQENRKWIDGNELRKTSSRQTIMSAKLWTTCSACLILTKHFLYLF
jgi:hypothetical protein